MNEPALQWLTEHASLPGTLASALRRPDGNFISHAVDPACTATTVETILTNFDALAETASTESTAPQWSTWAFEQGQIRLMERPDGWRLAVAVRNETEAATKLDTLAKDFLGAVFENSPEPGQA